MSFQDIHTAQDVAEYQTRLSTGYPQRPAVIAHIVKQIAALGRKELRIVELCVGPGVLAEAVCGAVGGIRYVGLDFMHPFLESTMRKLPAGADFQAVHGDLTDPTWPLLLKQAVGDRPIDAIVSMQSLHDVGDYRQTAQIYALAGPLLCAGGLFLNADLVSAEDELAPRPGRLTVAQHLELLREASFANVACSLRIGPFACCQGVWRATEKEIASANPRN